MRSRPRMKRFCGRRTPNRSSSDFRNWFIASFESAERRVSNRSNSSRVAEIAQLRLTRTGPIAVRFLRIVVLAVAAPLYLDAHPTSAASESPPSVLSIAVDGLSQGCERGTLAQD